MSTGTKRSRYLSAVQELLGCAWTAAIGLLTTNQIPAAILARTLGIRVNSAVRWQQISAGDWTSYAAEVSCQSRQQRAEPTDRR